MIPWEIKARELVNCNCDYGCPCQFNGRPSHGKCAAVAGFDIVEWRFGSVALNGLKAVGIMRWPGSIHEGGGEAQIIIDDKASEEQRQALLMILSGLETEPGKTIWNVFAARLERVFDPMFRPIGIEIDVDRRFGRRQRRTHPQSRNRSGADIPDGFEYSMAEIGSASAIVGTPISFELHDTYAQFANIQLSQSGIVKAV